MLALLVAGTFAAWQIAVFVLRRAKGPTRGAGDSAKLLPGVQWAGDPCSLKEMASSPLKAMGLTALDGDPGGVAPPQGARRMEAFQRRLEGQSEQRARYELRRPGAAGAAEEHYGRVLAGKGFVQRREVKSGGGSKRLIYAGDGAAATVYLRGLRATDKIEGVEIVLTMTRMQ